MEEMAGSTLHDPLRDPTDQDSRMDDNIISSDGQSSVNPVDVEMAGVDLNDAMIPDTKIGEFT